MDIKIYQIDMSKDKDNVAFMRFDSLKRLQGTEQINSSIYLQVYSGRVDAKNLEDVYYIFNMAHPADFRGHSLSVSDVVEVISDGTSSFYFCDSVGFKRVDFVPNVTVSLTRDMIAGPEIKHEDEQKNKKDLTLWARLGVTIKASAEELQVLQLGGKEAKDLLLSLVRSDKCVLDGETYFPGMANEKYFTEDIEFNIGPYALHPEAEKSPSQRKDFSELAPGEPEAAMVVPEAVVYMRSDGGFKQEIFSGTYEECLDFCESSKWEFKDEHDFLWSLELDDRREEEIDLPGNLQPLAEKIRNADARVGACTNTDKAVTPER